MLQTAGVSFILGLITFGGIAGITYFIFGKFNGDMTNVALIMSAYIGLVLLILSALNWLFRNLDLIFVKKEATSE
jgi:hypothetical protein